MKQALTLLLSIAALSTSASLPAQGRDVSDDTAAVVKQLESTGRYMRVRVLWRRRPGEPGPAAIIEGDWGGSAGNVDLYAPYGALPEQVRVLNLSKADDIAVHSSGRGPEFDAPFAVDRFNRASNAGASIVPLPIVWRSDDFQLDKSALLGRNFSPQDLRFRRIAAAYELNGWANSLDRPTTVYPAPANALDLGGTPITVQALMDLMLTGHVSEARRILHESWPSTAERTDIKAKGEQAFWNDLSYALRQNPLWKRFDLEHLPQAQWIDAAAAESKRPVS
jgi:hypothetical protein